MTETLSRKLSPFLNKNAEIDWSNCDLPAAPIKRRSEGLEANSLYFGHPEWAPSYFKFCHRNDSFVSRWRAAAGSWDDKIVIDIGCGPGNIYAAVGGSPKTLIGVDVSPGGLRMAKEIGYLPLLADAHNLPFIDRFADIVAVNATLHHCDDMPTVLKEAARLVKPGGVLVTDHDPQLTAWNFRGPARWAWNFRLTAYLWVKKGFHRSVEEQSVALASEIHHKPGRGVTPELYHEILRPLGFEVNIFPHNHDLGASVLDGQIGRSSKKYRVAQLLSGVNPNSPRAALSLLCRAKLPS